MTQIIRGVTRALPMVLPWWPVLLDRASGLHWRAVVVPHQGTHGAIPRTILAANIRTHRGLLKRRRLHPDDSWRVPSSQGGQFPSPGSGSVRLPFSDYGSSSSGNGRSFPGGEFLWPGGIGRSERCSASRHVPRNIFADNGTPAPAPAPDEDNLGPEGNIVDARFLRAI